MAIKAIEKLIKKIKLDIHQVDCIIVSTITPDMVFPSTACLIQNHFKIKIVGVLICLLLVQVFCLVLKQLTH